MEYIKRSYSVKTMQGKNDDILAWARNARPGTELAPAQAPPGQEIATFAGVRVLEW